MAVIKKELVEKISEVGGAWGFAVIRDMTTRREVRRFIRQLSVKISKFEGFIGVGVQSSFDVILFSTENQAKRAMNLLLYDGYALVKNQVDWFEIGKE